MSVSVSAQTAFERNTRRKRPTIICSRESNKYSHTLFYPAVRHTLSSITSKHSPNTLWRRRLQCFSCLRPHPFLFSSTMAPPHGLTQHYNQKKKDGSWEYPTPAECRTKATKEISQDSKEVELQGLLWWESTHRKCQSSLQLGDHIKQNSTQTTPYTTSAFLWHLVTGCDQYGHEL